MIDSEQPEKIVSPGDGHSATASAELERQIALAKIERLAWLLDSSIPVPLTGYRIGPESLIGLVPVVGDLAGVSLTGYLIWLARQHRAPRLLQLRMVGIAALDLVVGSIPLVGDLFDFAHKANARIAHLLASHLGQTDHEAVEDRRPVR